MDIARGDGMIRVCVTATTGLPVPESMLAGVIHSARRTMAGLSAVVHVVRGHCAGVGGESRPRHRSGTKGRPMQAGVFTFVRARLPEISTRAAIVIR